MATDTTREQMDRYGLACIKAVLFVNGGSAVALLALIAHLIVERPPLPSGVTNEIFLAFAIFVGGVGFGLLNAWFSYLGTWCYGYGERVGEQDRWNRIGENIFTPIAIFLGALSIGAFILGAYTAWVGRKAALSC